MKISKATLWGLLAVSAVGITIYMVGKKKDRKKLRRIADEGYEIAHDILFPDKLLNEKKLHYGPVLPE
jgi:hypothetical protein